MSFQSSWLRICATQLAPAIMAALILFVASPVQGAEQDESLQRVEALKLKKGQGRLFYYHSAGADKRAAHISQLIQEARTFFEGGLGLETDVKLAVLNEQDWRRINPNGPYGVPYVSGTPHVIFMPATDNNVITSSALAQKDNAPATLVAALRESGFSYEDWARISVDVIALHELGHAYTETYRLNPQNKWFNEFLASYHAYSFLAAKRPALAKLWRTATALQVAGPRPAHTSLEAFERLYNKVGVENYGWYQALFVQKAAQIHDAAGVGFIPRVHASFSRVEAQGDWLTAFLRSAQPLDATLERLEAIQPGFVGWGRSFRPSERG